MKKIWKYLWTYIAEKPWEEMTKNQVLLLILSAASALLGLLLWLIIRNFALDTWDWMACFIGYPVIASWFAVFLYSCNHSL